ncbi:MAG: hypothetical protein ACHQYP_02810 [Nitrospiria bacterium]
MTKIPEAGFKDVIGKIHLKRKIISIAARQSANRSYYLYITSKKRSMRTTNLSQRGVNLPSRIDSFDIGKHGIMAWQASHFISWFYPAPKINQAFLNIRVFNLEMSLTTKIALPCDHPFI